MNIRKYGDRTAVTLSCPQPGRAKQASLDECDINFIMNRWKRTGQLPTDNPRPPTYGDFSNVDDYMQAKNSIIQADQAFEALPSWVRERFQNSPHQLIRFLDDPRNLDEARKLGLVNPAAPEATPEPTPDATPDPTPEGTEGVTVISP